MIANNLMMHPQPSLAQPLPQKRHEAAKDDLTETKARHMWSERL